MRRSLLGCWLVLVACEAPRRVDLAPQDAGVGTQAQIGSALAEIREIEDHRLSADATLLRFLEASDARVLRAALVAAGRIGDAGYAPAVMSLLQHPDAAVRIEAIRALELIGHPDALTALRALAPTEAAELGAWLRARATFDDSESFTHVEEILAADPRPAARAGAAKAYARLVRSRDPALAPRPEVLLGLLGCAADSDAEDASDCASALLSAARVYKGLAPSLPAKALAEAIARAPNSGAASFLVYVLRRHPRELGEGPLRALLADTAASSEARAAALASLAALGAATGADYAVALDDASTPLRVSALGVLAQDPAARVDELTRERLVRLLAEESPWLRAEALPVLAAVAPELAAGAIEAAIAGGPSVLRAAVIASIASDAPRLLELARTPDVTLYSHAAAALAALPAERVPDGAHDATAALLERAAEDETGTRTLAVAALAGAKGWRDLLPGLLDLYVFYSGGGCAESCAHDTRVALLNAFAALGDASALPVVEGALADPARGIVAAAVQAYTGLAGKEPPVSVPPNSRVTSATPLETEVTRALGTRVRLSLRRGDIVLRMMPEAPVTAAKFVALAEAGFYDGSSFHRVIPAFVAQGGDPTGTGYGGPGPFVRDEVSRYGHRRGTVGMATSGRDTGTNQFFINLIDNVHLDDAYTAFAFVESGMDVALAIEGGDVVERVRVYPVR